MKTGASTETLPEGIKPLSFDGDMSLVERERTLFVAEDPDGTYHRYDPGTDSFIERDPITAEFLQQVAENSDPEEGNIVKQGDEDYSAQLVIGHEENKRFLHAANLASAGDVKKVNFDPETGELKVRVSMPKQVADWQDAGLFPKVSARFYEDYPKTGGGTLGPALGHVATLGTMQPVAKNLGPWSAALYSDNAEVAVANAKEAGLKVFSMAKGELVLDFAEGMNAGELRKRLVKKVIAEAESGMEFVVADIANTAGVTPEEVQRFVDGETDQLADPAMKALMRFIGEPTMGMDDEGGEGEEGGGAPAEGEGEEGGEGEEEVDETEPEGTEDMGETPMKKTAKKAAKKAAKKKAPATAPTAKDFAELTQQVNDLKFIAEQQSKKLKQRETTQSELVAQLNEQKKESRAQRILNFSEKMHAEGKFPGRARKAMLVEYLGGIGPEGVRTRDFAEGETTDELERAMEFIEKVAPVAVDNTGKLVAVQVEGDVRDFAELDADYEHYKAHVAESKKNGFPTNLQFRQFAEGNGHDPEDVEAFCRTKKIAHPAIKDGNAE